MWNPSALAAFAHMGFLQKVRDETDDEGEIEAEKRALRELLTTFRVKSQIELPGLADDSDAQNAIGRLIAQAARRRNH
jgi:hypothetical protein